MPVIKDHGSYAIEHVDLNEKVYSLLKEKILRRELAGGKKLDVGRLCDMIGVSRTPVKDALMRLQSDGLIEVKPRKGTYVKQLSIADIEHLLDVRIMIETWALRKLANEASPMKRLLEEWESILGHSQELLAAPQFSFDAFVEADVRFHTALVSGSGNPLLLEHYHLCNSLYQIARIYFYQNNERSVEGHKEHLAIMEAVKRHDFPIAEQLLQEHVERSRDGVIGLLRQRGGIL